MRGHGEGVLALAADGAARRPDGRVGFVLRPDKAGDLCAVVHDGDVRRVEVDVRDREPGFKFAVVVVLAVPAALRLGILRTGDRRGFIDDELLGGKGLHLVLRAVQRGHGEDMLALAGDGANCRPDGGSFSLRLPFQAGNHFAVVHDGDIRRVKVDIRDAERHFKRTAIVEHIVRAAHRVGVLHFGDRRRLVDDQQIGRGVGLHLVLRTVARGHGEDMLALAGDGADRRPDGRIIRILRPYKPRNHFAVVHDGDIRRVKVRVRDLERCRKGTGIVERVVRSAHRVGILHFGSRPGPVDDLRLGSKLRHFVARCVLGGDGDGMYALLGEGDRRSGGLTVGADRPVDRRFRTVNLDDRVNLAVREHQALVIRQRESNGGVAVIIAGRAV